MRSICQVRVWGLWVQLSLLRTILERNSATRPRRSPRRRKSTAIIAGNDIITILLARRRLRKAFSSIAFQAGAAIRWSLRAVADEAPLAAASEPAFGRMGYCQIAMQALDYLTGTQPKDRRRRRLAYWSPVALLLAIGLLGALYQGFSVAVEARRYMAPGRLVNVDGRQMHINCSGSGSPTVVLESGLGRYSLDWIYVQPEVAQFTRVCSYDRAGYGWSEYTAVPRTAANISGELERLLNQSGERPPYILVAQSLGGIIVRNFALRRRDAVVGMVLLESSHEQDEKRMPGRAASVAKSKRSFWKEIIGLYFGIPRITKSCGQDSRTLRPSGETVFLECRTTHYLTVLHEFETLAVAQPAPGPGAFGTMPVVVLMRDINLDNPEQREQDDPTWIQLQQELREMSEVGELVPAKGSGHFINLDKPEVVVAAIRHVWELSR